MYEIVFITSNNEKLAHARYLCRDYDVYITKQKFYGIGYNEPRVRHRKELFDRSINDASERWKKNVSSPDEKIFFIEDTSVIIPSLSKEGVEIPGVDIKYWMRENDFYTLDKKLKGNGSDRRAIVRSDIALVLNKKLSEKIGEAYKIFTSKIEGEIIDEEVNIDTQPYYTWLNNKTFNKWFIPNNCSQPLSSLPISKADLYDFRKGSFNQMLSFLEEMGVIKKKGPFTHSTYQLSFFIEPLFIVCGPTCAGKTTIAEYIAKNFNFYHLEASDFMYVRYYEHHNVGSKIGIVEFAERALSVDPSIVADQLNKNIKTLPKIPKIITGLRSPKEINEFLRKYDNEFPIEIIYVDADIEKRYMRNKIRKREIDVTDFESFRLLDLRQERMGLKENKELYKNSIIYNNSTKADYYNLFLNKYRDRINHLIKKTYSKYSKEHLQKNLEDLIITTLSTEDRDDYFTTTEIAHLITKKFPEYFKSKNNISRYFNQNFYPYYDIKKEKGKNYYRLSQTGISKANILKLVLN